MKNELSTMNIRKALLSIVLIIISLSYTNAQQSWSLQDCISWALDHNLDLKMQELNLQIQEKNVTQSKMNLLPDLNANASGSSNWGKTVDRYTNQFANSRVSSVNLYLQSSVSLFRGFQLLNSIRRENLELMAQKYDFNATRDMKSMEITTAYLQILYGMENLQSKINQVKISKSQLERTEKLVKAGNLAKGDLYNMKAQLASDESQKIQAENDLSIAYLNLKQLLDIPSDTAFEIQVPTLNVEPNAKLLSADVVYNYAEKNRPEIKSAESRRDRSLKDLAISKGSYMPSLSLSGGVGTGYSGANSILDGNPVFKGFYPSGDITSAGDTVLTPDFDFNTKTKAFSDQFSDNQNYSIGLYLSIPIFNRFQTKTKVDQSKIAIQQAELQLEKTKHDIRKTIEQAYADARSALKSYEASLLNVQALEESYTYAQQKYSAGMMNAFEFNDAKLKLENAKNNLLNAKYNYVFRIKVLDFYFGQPLNF